MPVEHTEHEKPMTVQRLKRRKQDGVPIVMLTAYDYPSAQIADRSGVDILLVGDSLGQVVQGKRTTLPVTMDEMVYHTSMVARATRKALVVADLPFGTYHGSVDRALDHMVRLVQEGGAHAVKLEGGTSLEAVRTASHAGIPVMGHLGLQPQAVQRLGGYYVQGRTSEAAQRLYDDALRLEEAGAFALVLELVTAEVALEVTQRLTIPTIGIGSGVSCDGQVLVFHDVVQYGVDIAPRKFVKTYADVGKQMHHAIEAYVRDVHQRHYPTMEHTFFTEK